MEYGVKYDLFFLIHSLTRGEKSFVLSQLKGQSGDKSLFEKMYSLITGQKEYDEGFIKSSLGFKPGEKQFAVIKKKLYEKIVVSITHYNDGSNVYHDLLTQIQSIRLFYNKGLYKQALKLISRAKKKAAEFEYQSLILELRYWEMRCEVKTTQFKDGKKFEKEIKQGLLDLDKFYNLSLQESKFISRQYDMLAGRDVLAWEELGSDLTKAILDEQIADEKVLSRNLQYRVKQIYYRMIRDGKKSNAYRDERVEYLEQHQEYVRENPWEYINARISQEFNIVTVPDPDQIVERMNSIRQLANELNLPEGNVVHVEIFLKTFGAELDVLTDFAQFDRAITMIPSIESFIQKNIHLVDKPNRVKFQYRFAHINYGAGNIGASLKHINNIYRIKDMKSGVLQYFYTYILELLIHFEQNNIDILESKLRASDYRVKKHKMVAADELRLIKFINEQFYNPTGDLNGAYLGLKQDLLDLHSKGTVINTNFSILSWIDSKVNNTDYRTEVYLRRPGTGRQYA